VTWKYPGVDLDDQVVLGDDRLGAERDDLLAQVDRGVDAVGERDDEVKSRPQGAMVAAEPLDVAGARLRHDAHGTEHDHEREQGDHQAGDHGG